ncbi:MAG: GNAT family N-acetyltransferase [Gemmatimonadaceae bacterium]
MVVRAATAADVDLVLSLRLALVDDEARRTRQIATPPVPPPGRRAPPAAEATGPAALVRARERRRARSLVNERLGDTSHVTFLALRGGEAVGVLRCMLSGGATLTGTARYGYLASGFVHPRFRRAGVLRALVSAAQSWCAARGVHEMRLQCALHNAMGHAAWSALGFAPFAMIRRRLLSPT